MCNLFIPIKAECASRPSQRFQETLRHCLLYRVLTRTFHDIRELLYQQSFDINRLFPWQPSHGGARGITIDFSLVSSVKVLDIQGCHRGSETQKHSFTLFRRSHPPSVYICLIIKSICAFNCDLTLHPLWVQRRCSNAVRAGVRLINICRPMSHFSKRRQWVFLTRDSICIFTNSSPTSSSQTS